MILMSLKTILEMSYSWLESNIFENTKDFDLSFKNCLTKQQISYSSTMRSLSDMVTSLSAIILRKYSFKLSCLLESSIELNKSSSKPSDITAGLIRTMKVKRMRSFIENNGGHDSEEDENSMDVNPNYLKYTIDQNIPKLDLKQCDKPNKIETSIPLKFFESVSRRPTDYNIFEAMQDAGNKDKIEVAMLTLRRTSMIGGNYST